MCLKAEWDAYEAENPYNITVALLGLLALKAEVQCFFKMVQGYANLGLWKLCQSNYENNTKMAALQSELGICCWGGAVFWETNLWMESYLIPDS